MTKLDFLFNRLRKLLNSFTARGRVSVVNDDSKIQTVQAEFLKDEIYDDVPRFQNYGFTSVPLEGAEGVGVFPGGVRDKGFLICVDDRRYRLKGLKGGEVAIYTDEGDSIVLKRDNKMEFNTKELTINSATSVNIKTALAKIETPTAEITGNLLVKGTVTSEMGVFSPSYSGPTAGSPVVADGPIQSSGDVSDSAGSMSQMRAKYNAHKHGSGPVTDQPM